MENFASTARQSLATQLPLTARLTIGSALCLTEGIFASILVLLPKNIWFYIAGAILTLCTWLAFFRFRDTKLGADVADICFWDFISRSVAPFILYFDLLSPATIWYIWTMFSVLKIIRVYIWNASQTQQHGWLTFGPMTRHYSKHHANSANTSLPPGRLFIEIGIALIVAVLVSLGIKQLDDFERVVAVWIVPLTFEFLYGPRQLRALANFGNLLMASTAREAEKDAEIARLKSALKARTNQTGPEDETIDAITATAQATTPRMREHILLYARNVASQFPEESQDGK